MSVFVDYPTDWIGIPQFGPDERWARPELWTKDLLDEITAGARVKRGQRTALDEVFIMIARGVSERGASMCYVFLAGWSGPIYFADLRVQPRSSAGTISLEDYAGASDPRIAEGPDVKPFVTQSGLQGVRCIRYTTPEEQPPGLIAQIGYAWEIGDDLALLSYVGYDLVGFESILPRLDELAAGIYGG